MNEMMVELVEVEVSVADHRRPGPHHHRRRYCCRCFRWWWWSSTSQLAEKAFASRKSTSVTSSAPAQPVISFSTPAAQPSVTPSQSFTANASASASEFSINAFRQGPRRRRGTPNRRETTTADEGMMMRVSG